MKNGPVRSYRDHLLHVRVKKVVAYDEHLFMGEDGSVEIAEDKEPREEESGRPPEWTGDPRIQAIIGIGWGIVGDDRRTFRFVVVIHRRRRRGVLVIRRRPAFNIGLCRIARNGQAYFLFKIRESL